MPNSSADRLLYLLKSTGAKSARDAGDALGMTSAGAQQHFARLADENLVEPEDVKHGRGRPRRVWKLTSKGHGRFPDRHADLTLGLLNATRELFGEEGLERLIQHREETTKAHYVDRTSQFQDTESRVAALAQARKDEGYMARSEALADGGYLLIEDHCPVCAAASACQGLCRSELAIFQEVLGPDVTVSRDEYILDGGRRCTYRIIPV